MACFASLAQSSRLPSPRRVSVCPEPRVCRSECVIRIAHVYTDTGVTDAEARASQGIGRASHGAEPFGARAGDVPHPANAHAALLASWLGECPLTG